MSIGKRVRDSLYLHRSVIGTLPDRDADRIHAASPLCDFEWNVVRLSKSGITFLRYGDFEDDPFPALQTSIAVSHPGAAGVRRDYGARSNPPILHRKELLVGPDHPRWSEWSANTERLVQAGAFLDAHRIGTKRAWSERLDRLRLEMDGRSK